MPKQLQFEHFEVPMLRDQDLSVAEVVSARDFYSGSYSEGDHWFVVVSEDGTPVRAVGPEQAEPSMVIVANADLTVPEALDARAFKDAGPDTAVAVIEPESRRVLGIWSGASLTLALQQHPLADSANLFSPLPGDPNIPYIVHTCTYMDGGVTCATLATFDRRPVVMPMCGNDAHHLTAHDFVW
jgi:hypothetical protein